jgi:hypothetical protein
MAADPASPSWSIQAILTQGGPPVFNAQFAPGIVVAGKTVLRPPVRSAPRYQFVGTPENIAALPDQLRPLFPLLAQFQVYLQSLAQQSPVPATPVGATASTPL